MDETSGRCDTRAFQSVARKLPFIEYRNSCRKIQTLPLRHYAINCNKLATPPHGSTAIRHVMQWLLADKDYDSDAFRKQVKSARIRQCIPAQSNMKTQRNMTQSCPGSDIRSKMCSAALKIGKASLSEQTGALTPFIHLSLWP